MCNLPQERSMEIRGHITEKLLKVIYYMLGISLNLSHQKYITAICLAMFLFGIPAILYPEIRALITLDSAIFRAEATMMLSAAAVFLVLILVIQIQRSHWVRFYEDVVNVFNGHFFDESFTDNLYTQLILDRWYPTCWLSSLIFFFVFPMVNVYGTDVELGSYKTLLLPTKYPWGASTPLTYALTLGFQVFCTSFQFSVYLGCMAFTYYFRAFHLSTKMVYKRKIARLNSTSSDKKALVRRNLECRRDLKLLQDVVRDHQFSLRVGIQYQYLMTPLTHMATLNFFTSGVFLMFTTLMAKNNLVHCLKLINMQIAVYLPLLLLSSDGQIFEEMNGQIMYELYNINWYQKSTEFRREMLIFMILLQKEQHKKIFKTKVVNWKFITSIIKFTYSVFQVFMKAKGRSIIK